ncbi:Serum paraoxonase/lactonase 3 [Mactra antiquata]
MLGSAISLGVFSVAMYYMLQYRDWLDWNKSFIYRVTPGPCQYVTKGGGSEDLTHIGDGIVLISSAYYRGLYSGAILRLNLTSNDVTPMEIVGGPGTSDFMFFIHGISTWKDPETGILELYVLTHPSKGDKIEVFEMTGEYQLTYARSITDPRFTFMNDLVVVGRDKFYITKFWEYRDKLKHFLETLLWMKYGGIFYYDGTHAREMVSGLDLPNGINVSPDGRMVYTAEYNNKKVLAYHRDEYNMLTKAWEVYADSAVDNIEVDPITGDLWIGCHPIAYRVLDTVYKVFGYTLPSQVLRFKMRDNMVSEIEEIYADDSTNLAGSTVATYVDGKLVIGTAASKTLVCDVKYHSK